MQDEFAGRATTKLKTYPHLLVCEYCDRVYHRPSLVRGQRAHCSVCGQRLPCGAPFSCEYGLALSLASLMVFLLLMCSPVIQIGFRGRYSDATLWQSAMAFSYGICAPIAVPVAFILCVPLLQSLLQCWLLAFALAGKVAPGFVPVLRSVSWLRHWSMVEVCLLGALVAMIKLAGYLDVQAGIGLWALAALTLLNGLSCSQSMTTLWERKA